MNTAKNNTKSVWIVLTLVLGFVAVVASIGPPRVLHYVLNIL